MTSLQVTTAGWGKGGSWAWIGGQQLARRRDSFHYYHRAHQSHHLGNKRNYWKHLPPTQPRDITDQRHWKIQQDCELSYLNYVSWCTSLSVVFIYILTFKLGNPVAYETRKLMLYSQGLSNNPYPETNQHTSESSYFLKIHYNVVLPTMPRPYSTSLFCRFTC